ncbi:uncharacterized protein LOC106716303 isoform X3 [Papilio machaon]|uniref:uncharacterized protein LOC106716303 isoform X3 n=1 Tax=Papilio machaon TaxID=76193 RepID=UPI001E66577E|nr:uncharacterized protein LOC106716303 isoform X3 [Papilio machaon]
MSSALQVLRIEKSARNSGRAVEPVGRWFIFTGCAGATRLRLRHVERRPRHAPRRSATLVWMDCPGTEKKPLNAACAIQQPACVEPRARSSAAWARLRAAGHPPAVRCPQSQYTTATRTRCRITAHLAEHLRPYTSLLCYPNTCGDPARNAEHRVLHISYGFHS